MTGTPGSVETGARNRLRRMAVWLAAGWILSACAIPPAVARPAETALPAPTDTPVAYTPTPTLSPTSVPTPTDTLPPTATEKPTDTPSPVPASFLFVYPIQPPDGSGFSQGGHGYPAIDIFAPAGARFVAVTGGVVDFVSTKDRWDPATDDPALRCGLCVAIIGDDGLRYYGAHLSEVADGIRPGVRVEAGDLLGLVGNTGNARSTPPHLHFGISHPTFPEDWLVRRGELEPYPYLVAWRNGYTLRPAFPSPTPGEAEQAP
jgi:murein DD-endopeptidase MepM/ murein hydrolase activator NlpD